MGATRTKEVDGFPIADERGREPPERLSDQDRIRPLADRLDHDVGVLWQAGRIVLTREIWRHGLVTPCTKLGRNQVPVPANVAGAVDQDVRGHGPVLSSPTPSEAVCEPVTMGRTRDEDRQARRTT